MLPTQDFLQFIKKNSLFEQDNRVLLAVSGGKDSVLMAHLFKSSNIKFGIAHCNFNLRSTEAPRDALFVEKLALALDVPFFITQFDTQAFAKQHQLSTQMAARELRYQWFEEIRNSEKYDFIALAHHKNDVTETMLLNLVRGTGISGLHGILPKKNKLIRPLLFLNSEEINQIVAKNNINYVEDSSNASEKYARNKIRLTVIPALESLNPNLSETFQQNANRFLETEQALHQLVEITKTNICKQKNADIEIELAAIENLYPKKLLLFEILRDYNFASPVVDDILNSLDKQSGTCFYSPSHCANINRTALLISPIKVHRENEIFIQQDTHSVEFNDIKINFNIQDFPQEIEQNTNKAFVNFDKLIYPLTLRYWQQGDQFIPFGMSNFKKISDFFIDKKVALQHKSNIPILINGNGEIMWVVGYRTDNRYKISAETKKIITLETEIIDYEK
ncbi:MAG: tRNA lysidine(34) synthetase TilS [Sphingobacteriaceae bacterium]|nr:tRNA lysidine(34) synthetase TilS [Sphingobacteriaceae bacterium]